MLFFYVQSSAFIIEPSHTNNLKQTYDTPPLHFMITVRKLSPGPDFYHFYRKKYNSNMPSQ